MVRTRLRLDHAPIGHIFFTFSIFFLPIFVSLPPSLDLLMTLAGSPPSLV